MAPITPAAPSRRILQLIFPPPERLPALAGEQRVRAVSA